MTRVFCLQTLLSFIVTCFVLFDVAAALPSSQFAQLERCVGEALMGPDAQLRIQTPEDATYDDARVGAMM